MKSHDIVILFKYTWLLNFREFRKRRDAGFLILFTVFVAIGLGVVFTYRNLLEARHMSYPAVLLCAYCLIQQQWLFMQPKTLLDFSPGFASLPLSRKETNVASCLYQTSKAMGIAAGFLYFAIVSNALIQFLIATIACIAIGIPASFYFWLPKRKAEKIIKNKPLWFNLTTFFCSPWAFSLFYCFSALLLFFTPLSDEGKLGGRFDGSLIMIDLFAVFATTMKVDKNWKNARFMLNFPISFARWQAGFYKAGFIALLCPRIISALCLAFSGLNPWRFLVGSLASTVMMASMFSPGKISTTLMYILLGLSPFCPYFFVGGINWSPLAWPAIVIWGLLLSRRDHSMVACFSVSEGDRLARV